MSDVPNSRTVTEHHQIGDSEFAPAAKHVRPRHISDSVSFAESDTDIPESVLYGDLGSRELETSQTAKRVQYSIGYESDEDTDIEADRPTSAQSNNTQVLLPVPPDGGWGWLVCFSAFLCFFFLDGMMFSFGVLYLDLLEYFGESKGKTAWVGSTMMGTSLLAGPIVSGIVHLIGIRWTTIIGAIIASASFALSILAPSIDVLIITYGVLGGIGVSMVYISSILIVGFYFEKKRALANGIASSGSGVGTFVYAPLGRYLMNEYTWRGALLILAGMVLNCVACGATYRPLDFSRLSATAESQESNMTASTTDDETQSFLRKRTMRQAKRMDSSLPGINVRELNVEINTKNKSDLHLSSSDLTQEHRERSNSMTPQHRQLQRVVQQNADQFGDHPEIGLSNNLQKTTPPIDLAQAVLDHPKRISVLFPAEKRPSKALLNNLVESTPNIARTQKQSKFNGGEFTHSTGQIAKVLNPLNPATSTTGLGKPSTSHSQSLIGKPLYRKDIFYSGSIARLPEVVAAGDNRMAFSGSMLRLPDEPVTVDKTATHNLAEVQMALKQMLDFRLLKTPIFLLCTVMGVLWTTHSSVLALLPDYAVQCGIDKSQAGLLISVIGISNITGRLAAGWLADRPWSNVVALNGSALLMGGLMNFILPFTKNYFLLIGEAGIFGICMGTWTSLRPIVLVELMGLEKLTNAFGLLALFQGLAFILGPPVAGVLYDLTESYKVVFMTAGSAFLISSLTCVPMSFLAKFERKQRYMMASSVDLRPVRNLHD